MKCQACQQNMSEWSMHPWGPDDKGAAFTLPGFHYRGFDIVKVCRKCKEEYQNGITITFTFRHAEYTASLKHGIVRIYESLEEAEPAMTRGETVHIRFKPEDIDPRLLALARDLQDKKRLEEFKEAIREE